MAALDAGAHHVTAVERWIYLSVTCKETLKLNSFEEDRFKVIYKRPTDLRLQTDVPILCNLLMCDILDEGKLEDPQHTGLSECNASSRCAGLKPRLVRNHRGEIP